MLQELLPDGSAVLVGGRVVTGLDAVVYCTGYRVTLPWLDHLGLLETGSCKALSFSVLLGAAQPVPGPGSRVAHTFTSACMQYYRAAGTAVL